MTVELTRKGNINAVDYTLTGAPDIPTAKGKMTMRPSWCTVKFFNDEAGKVEVHGNVVSKATGEIGNRVATETFVLYKPDVPAFVHEIAEVATAAAQARAEDKR